jgi:hypothetical protein
MSQLIYSWTVHSPRTRVSARSSLPNPSPSSPSPFSEPPGISSLSLTSPATSRPVSRPYCRHHPPQNTDRLRLLPYSSRQHFGRQRRHRTSTRRTFWVSLFFYTRSHNFHVTINSLKHPFDSLTSRESTSPMVVSLPNRDHFDPSPSCAAPLHHLVLPPAHQTSVPSVVDNRLCYPGVHAALPSPTILSLPSSFAAPQHRSISPSLSYTLDRCLTRCLFALFVSTLSSPNNAASHYINRHIRPLLFIPQLTSHSRSPINANASPSTLLTPITKHTHLFNQDVLFVCSIGLYLYRGYLCHLITGGRDSACPLRWTGQGQDREGKYMSSRLRVQVRANAPGQTYPSLQGPSHQGLSGSSGD